MANAPANIVYPIHGGTYPISDPAAPPPLSSAYVTFSFGVTCEGGQHSVEWGVDGQTFGRAEYYDQFSAPVRPEDRRRRPRVLGPHRLRRRRRQVQRRLAALPHLPSALRGEFNVNPLQREGEVASFTPVLRFGTARAAARRARPMRGGGG